MSFLKISPFFVAIFHRSELRNTTDGAGSLKILPNNSISLSAPPHSNVASGPPYSTTYFLNTLKKANYLGKFEEKGKSSKETPHHLSILPIGIKSGRLVHRQLLCAEELNQRFTKTSEWIIYWIISSFFAQQGYDRYSPLFPFNIKVNV